MTNKNVKELIADLGYTKVKEHQVTVSIDARVEEILAGKFCHNKDKDVNELRIGIAKALEKTYKLIKAGGYIATMPELIAARVKADKSDKLWSFGIRCHTEENIGIDKKGFFYQPRTPVLVIVNGGGLLTPQRIFQAYSDGLFDGGARYTDEEFDMLLQRKVADGSRIDMYKFEDIEAGIDNLPHRFGIVAPYRMMEDTKSGQHEKEKFVSNPLAIARNAGVKNLLEYHAMTNFMGRTGCYHPFDYRNPVVRQGRLLFLGSRQDGLDGYDPLHNDGRFVVVKK